MDYRKFKSKLSNDVLATHRKPDAPATVENPLRTPWRVEEVSEQVDASGFEQRWFYLRDCDEHDIADSERRPRLQTFCDAVNERASLLARLEKLEAVRDAAQELSKGVGDSATDGRVCLARLATLRAALDADANKETI